MGQDNTSTKSDINITLDKYSERVDGPVEISVYQSSDEKIWATVYKNTQPNGYDISALRDEISKIENSQVLWKKEPEIENISGHLAISTRIYEATDEGKIIIPGTDRNYTAIAYPNDGYILTIRSKGENMDRKKHMAIVKNFML
jgi:hypothetical protein